ncbi:MAG: PD-(D/E)XK nuclease family protein [Corynebacterium sp.]|nr:PD-(D/E)XK nuclease family protein [Corynebacterium sp.]
MPHPPVALSPSRAHDYTKCPLSFRFAVVDKLPQEPKVHLITGTLVHKVLEDTLALPAAERTYPRAVKMIVPAWEAALAADPALGELIGEADRMDFFVRCRELIKGYFTMENPQGLGDGERELFISLTIPGIDGEEVPLRGIIDRVDVSPSGLVRIVDYKTGKKPNRFNEQQYLEQLLFYALVWWRTRGEIPAELRLMFLSPQYNFIHHPTHTELETTEQRLASLWAAIVADGRAGTFAPRPSRLCDWCDYQAHCPVFGGTPPPYPGWPNDR